MNYNRKDIIAALATTPGISAISVIRISGENLMPLLQSITKKKIFKVIRALKNWLLILKKNNLFSLIRIVTHWYLFTQSHRKKIYCEMLKEFS